MTSMIEFDVLPCSANLANYFDTHDMGIQLNKCSFLHHIYSGKAIYTLKYQFSGKKFENKIFRVPVLMQIHGTIT